VWGGGVCGGGGNVCMCVCADHNVAIAIFE
jgi:hypothetical protein